MGIRYAIVSLVVREKGKKMKVIWLTDIHLNFLGMHQIKKFVKKINEAAPDAIFITGDISEAPSILDCLFIFSRFENVQTYFVLGNHDYYKGSIEHVNSYVTDYIKQFDNLHFMDNETFIELNENTCLIGNTGWYDGRFGDFMNSRVLMQDYNIIHDFMGLTKSGMLGLNQKLAEKSAQHIQDCLIEAFDRYQNVVLLTHIPPFWESCVHNGKMSDSHWAPHFSSKIMGEVIEEFMKDRSGHLTVLCGHTHGSGEIDILPNVRVITGSAEYYKPKISRVFEY